MTSCSQVTYVVEKENILNSCNVDVFQTLNLGKGGEQSSRNTFWKWLSWSALIWLFAVAIALAYVTSFPSVKDCGAIL